MKHRAGSNVIHDDPVTLTRVLRTRNMTPEERAPIEQRLDAARIKLGLCPIQRQGRRNSADPQSQS